MGHTWDSGGRGAFQQKEQAEERDRERNRMLYLSYKQTGKGGKLKVGYEVGGVGRA